MCFFVNAFACMLIKDSIKMKPVAQKDGRDIRIKYMFTS